MRKFVAGLAIGIALTAAGSALAAYPNLFPQPGQRVLWLGGTAGPICGTVGPGARKVLCQAGKISVVFTRTTVIVYSLTPSSHVLYTVRRPA